MKKILSLFLAMLILISHSTLFAQEFEEAYYQDNEIVEEPYSPYDPTAPVYGVRAGVAYAKIGIGLAAIAVAAAIIATSGNGSASHD